jgi:hypothetical protein
LIFKVRYTSSMILSLGQLCLTGAMVVAILTPSAQAAGPFTEGLTDAYVTAFEGGLSTRGEILPFLTDIIKWLLGLSALLAIGALVWGGIMYIMSLGDEGRAGTAKKIILYAIIGVIVILLSLFDVPTAHAAEGFKGVLEEFKPTATEAGLSTKDNALVVITNIIEWLLALSAVLAMGAFVWGGIMYITSLGDEGRAGTAKKIILYAIIGVIVVLLSFVIVQFIQIQLGTPSIVFAVPVAYAQEVVPPPAPGSGRGFNLGVSTIRNVLEPASSGLATDSNIINVILRVVNFLLALVAVLALAVMVWGAIMYILSLGDESRAEKAKKIILFAIIGVLLAGVSFLILTVLQNLLISP